jgi:hypothetical protein
MSKDITEQLKIAFEKSSSWSREKFIEYLNLLGNSVMDSEKDWDEYAGERWATVLLRGEVIAYISKDIPLLFISYEFMHVTKPFEELVVIWFSDNDSAEYSVDSDVFQDWSKGRSKTGGLDVENLSVSDIWWATII